MFVVACVTKTEDHGRGGLWVDGVLMGDGASVSLVRCARCVRPRRFGLHCRRLARYLMLVFPVRCVYACVCCCLATGLLGWCAWRRRRDPGVCSAGLRDARQSAAASCRQYVVGHDTNAATRWNQPDGATEQKNELALARPDTPARVCL